METQSQQLETTPASRSNPTSSRKDLINEWLTRFALNADKALGTKERAVYLSTWADAFADVDPDRLQAAFVACLRSHVFPKMPTIADVRQHLAKAETGAAQFEAEQKWTQVLDYLRLSYSPDAPGGAYRGAPKIGPRTDHAIRAAGGLAYLNECERESLQWAKKRFIEAYLSWGERDKGQFLLPDGELKKILAGVAETKQLQAPLQCVTQYTPDIAKEREASTVYGDHAEQSAGTPERECTVWKTPQREKLLAQQAEKIKAKYPKPGNMAGIPQETASIPGA